MNEPAPESAAETWTYADICVGRDGKKWHAWLDAASGQAEAGEPWQHYDLGHGLCSYTFFEQCQHRMACAKCDFCIPKN